MDDERKKPEEETQPDEAEGRKSPESQSGSEILASEAELTKLRAELETREQEAKENYDRFVRQVAELENFKKRTAREKEEAIRYANESLVKDLLPILDNLERAVEHAKGEGNGKPLVEGVEMVLKGFLDALQKHGITQLSAAGQVFDPEKHEAMTQIESATHEPNTVIEEFQKGYSLVDRLLRPALVSVAKAPETKEKKNEEVEVEKAPGDD